MCAIADQPDSTFARYVATVSNILCLMRLCLVIVFVDFSTLVNRCFFAAPSVIFLFRDNKSIPGS